MRKLVVIVLIAMLATPVGAAEVVGKGRFSGKNGYDVKGKAKIVVASNGKRVVRLAKNFETDGGPGLRVWLSRSGPNSGDASLNDRFVDLGSLKTAKGKQSYKIPKGVKLGRYKSFVIWCSQAVMAFGTAPIR